MDNATALERRSTRYAPQSRVFLTADQSCEMLSSQKIKIRTITITNSKNGTYICLSRDSKETEILLE